MVIILSVKAVQNEFSSSSLNQRIVWSKESSTYFEKTEITQTICFRVIWYKRIY